MNFTLRVTQAALVLAGSLGAVAEYRATGAPDTPRAWRDDAPAVADLDAMDRGGLPGRRLAALPPRPAAPGALLAAIAHAEPIEPAARVDRAPRLATPFRERGRPGGPSLDYSGDPATWRAGKDTFERKWTPKEGLGAPGFNGASCAECHHDPVTGGAGGNEFNVTRGQATGGGHSYLRRKGALDGLDRKTRRELLAHLKEFEREARKRDRRSRGSSGLQTPSLLGLGLIDSIPEEEIARNADPADRDGDGVRGRVSRVDVPRAGVQNVMDVEVGRFGWTAEVPRLADFVCLALGGETGLTVPDQGRGFELTEDDDRTADPELDQSSLDELVLYMANLAPPTRGGRAHEAEVETGRRLFESIGCAACHVPSLRGADGRPVELYSDLLLHEAVKLSAEDELRLKGRSGIALLRTPPLWGVRDTGPYLHDGSAETLRDAILAHDLEAKPARDRFRELLEYDAGALIAFLRDL